MQVTAEILDEISFFSNHQQENYIIYGSKKSSGRIEPNKRSWFVLKETTPYPKRSGLILLSKTTTGALEGFESDTFFFGAEVDSYNDYSKTKRIQLTEESLNAYIHNHLRICKIPASKIDKELVSSSFLSIN